MQKVWLLVVILSWLFITKAFALGRELPHDLPQELRFAATDWCPYVCAKGSQQQGFIHDYLSEVFAQHGVKLKVTVLPWSRAILTARAGEYDGLLTAVRSEAPDFAFPSVPTGSYQMCLYADSAAEYKYEGRESLSHKKLGVIKDYGYGAPIDDVIANPRNNELVISISSKTPLKQLVKMLELDRIEMFIEDANVLNQYAREFGDGWWVKEIGCLQEIEFFTAISPTSPYRHELLRFLNTNLQQDAAKQALEHAKSQY